MIVLSIYPTMSVRNQLTIDILVPQKDFTL